MLVRRARQSPPGPWCTSSFASFQPEQHLRREYMTGGCGPPDFASWLVSWIHCSLQWRSGSCDCYVREHCRVASFPPTPGNLWGTPWNPEKQWSPAPFPKERTKVLQAIWKREKCLDAQTKQNRVTPPPTGPSAHVEQDGKGGLRPSPCTHPQMGSLGACPPLLWTHLCSQLSCSFSSSDGWKG